MELMRPICMECGQSLEALPSAGACPECGTAYTERSRFPPMPPRVGTLLRPFAWRLPLILLVFPAVALLVLTGGVQNQQASAWAVPVLWLVVLIPCGWLLLNLHAAYLLGTALCARWPRAVRKRALISGIPFLTRQVALGCLAALLATPILVCTALMIVAGAAIILRRVG